MLIRYDPIHNFMWVYGEFSFIIISYKLYPP